MCTTDAKHAATAMKTVTAMQGSAWGGMNDVLFPFMESTAILPNQGCLRAPVCGTGQVNLQFKYIMPPSNAA